MISKLIAILDNIITDDPRGRWAGEELIISGERKKRTYQTENFDDPLADLYQLDSEENIPLEEEALIVMIKMLDNLEEFRELSDDLRNLMEKDQLTGTRILNLLKVLITGVQVEYNRMGYMP